MTGPVLALKTDWAAVLGPWQVFPWQGLGLGASFFFGVRIRLGTILGPFSIIYFRGLGWRIRVRVKLWVRDMVRVWVSVVLWSV